ncbi:MAG: P-type conjugative transfer protein TrbL [Candidatus Omnitrophica bacterium]|nr:P-type conjugative transfer protein TrbL [Candidatus Omnitrophota bacterium]
MDPAQTINTILKSYNDVAFTWTGQGLNYGRHLYSILALIQIVWCGFLWMLRRGASADWLVDVVKKILFLTLMWGLLINYEYWVPPIYNSFARAGAQMSGLNSFQPGRIIGQGISLSSLIIAKGMNIGHALRVENISAGIFCLIVGLAIFFVFARIGIEVIFLLIGGKMLLAGGAIVLGFAASPWTARFAMRYIQGMVYLGIRLMFLILMIGVGEPLTRGWQNLIKVTAFYDWTALCLTLSAGTLILYYLTVRLPELAARLFVGEGSLS